MLGFNPAPWLTEQQAAILDKTIDRCSHNPRPGNKICSQKTRTRQNYLKDFLGIEGEPAVMAGFGFSQSTITNHEKHQDNPRPSISDIIV